MERETDRKKYKQGYKERDWTRDKKTKDNKE
jgi:hypothetical protein